MHSGGTLLLARSAIEMPLGITWILTTTAGSGLHLFQLPICAVVHIRTIRPAGMLPLVLGSTLVHLQAEIRG